MFSVQTPPIYLGEFVMLLRKRKGLTIREAAKQAQVPRAQWRDLEACNYQYITITSLSRVMDVLGFTVRFDLRPDDVDDTVGGGE